MVVPQNELSIIVKSCDKFSDVWRPFFILFDKFWPDCPWPIYLITETQKFVHPKVITINTSGGSEWSAMLIYALGQIETTNVLFLLEDYFLNKTVSTDEIKRLLEAIKNDGALCLRLYPTHSMELKTSDSEDFGVIDNQEEYLVSTQASIWKKEELLSLLVSTENVWDFERNASIRARNNQVRFCSVWLNTTLEKIDKGNYPFRYLFLTSITRGKWTMKTVNFCKKHNVYLDLKARKANNKLDEFYMNKSPLFVRHIIDFVNCRTKKYFGIDLRTYPLA